MANFDIPPKPKLSNQLIATALVLLVVAIVVALLTKYIIAFIIFLIAVITGAGGRYYKSEL